MKDVWVHTGLFLVVSAVFIVIAAFYSEAEDGPALRSVPRRYAVFVGACAIVAAAMLVLEHLFVAVG